jgi:Xaa-Pro aminopeptidase
MITRTDRIATALESSALDAVICFLPENILCLTGYWPSTGDSALVQSKEGKKLLVAPAVDEPFLPGNLDGDIVRYDITPDDIRNGDLRGKIMQPIQAAIRNWGLDGGSLGWEASFDTIAGSFRGSEANVPGLKSFEELSLAFPGTRFQDASPLLRELRKIKTPLEIEALRRSNTIAAYAFAQARQKAHPGVKEIEVAAVLESSFQEFGVSYQGVHRARGYAFVMSGPKNSYNAWLPANFSTNRVLEDGDLLLIEFNGFADGFWVDLSRTFIVGEASARQVEITTAVLEALDRTLHVLRPGVTAAAVDETARACFRSRGLEEYFAHYIGHGVGFAFHEQPVLQPGSVTTLERGMVLAIEPGLYIEGVGGVRIEENVLITADGAELLSAFDRNLLPVMN